MEYSVLRHGAGGGTRLLLFLLGQLVCWGASSASSATFLDLSDSYVRDTGYNDSELAKNLTNLASSRLDVTSVLALEDGRIVAEYYARVFMLGFSERTRFPVWSGTKSWMSLIFGVMVKEGLLSVDETLWDIWPDETLWETIEDRELRQKTTIESLMQMRAGFRMPLDFALADTFPISGGKLGGKDFYDALTYHTINEDQIGSFHYVSANNLVSYIVKERTGLTPEEFARQRIFPRLGITQDDYKWDTNKEGVSLGYHGLYLTVKAYSKLGMLYLQGGKTSEDDTEGLISEEWIARTFTVGDRDSNNAYGYFFWVENDGGRLQPEDVTVFCSKGIGGTLMCINTATTRVIVVAGLNFDDRVAEWFEGDDAYPHNQLAEMFLGISPANKDKGFADTLGIDLTPEASTEDGSPDSPNLVSDPEVVDGLTSDQETNDTDHAPTESSNGTANSGGLVSKEESNGTDSTQPEKEGIFARSPEQIEESGSLDMGYGNSEREEEDVIVFESAQSGSIVGVPCGSSVCLLIVLSPMLLFIFRF